MMNSKVFRNEYAVNKVLIFKAPTESSTGNVNSTGTFDDYQIQLNSNGFISDCIPVLDFQFINLECLKDALKCASNFSGLIFTSPRSVEAVSLSLENTTSLPADWSEKRIFVVGKTTGELVQEKLHLRSEGEHCGNGKALADYIIGAGPFSKPLLFPASSLKKEVLPDALRTAGIQLHILTVYKTIPNPCLKSRLQKSICEEGLPNFLVFFSPSGVKFALPVLTELGVEFNNVKIVSLGPSTSEAIRALGLDVWSQAEHPTPEGYVKQL